MSKYFQGMMMLLDNPKTSAFFASEKQRTPSVRYNSDTSWTSDGETRIWVVPARKFREHEVLSPDARDQFRSSESCRSVGVGGGASRMKVNAFPRKLEVICNTIVVTLESHTIFGTHVFFDAAKKVESFESSNQNRHTYTPRVIARTRRCDTARCFMGTSSVGDSA